MLSLPKKGNGHLGKQALEVARLVHDEENDCRFELHIYANYIVNSCLGKITGVIL